MKYKYIISTILITSLLFSGCSKKKESSSYIIEYNNIYIAEDLNPETNKDRNKERNKTVMDIAPDLIQFITEGSCDNPQITAHTDKLSDEAKDLLLIGKYTPDQLYVERGRIDDETGDLTSVLIAIKDTDNSWFFNFESEDGTLSYIDLSMADYLSLVPDTDDEALSNILRDRGVKSSDLLEISAAKQAEEDILQYLDDEYTLSDAEFSKNLQTLKSSVKINTSEEYTEDRKEYNGILLAGYNLKDADIDKEAWANLASEAMDLIVTGSTDNKLLSDCVNVLDRQDKLLLGFGTTILSKEDLVSDGISVEDNGDISLLWVRTLYPIENTYWRWNFHIDNEGRGETSISVEMSDDFKTYNKILTAANSERYETWNLDLRGISTDVTKVANYTGDMVAAKLGIAQTRSFLHDLINKSGIVENYFDREPEAKEQLNAFYKANHKENDFLIYPNNALVSRDFKEVIYASTARDSASISYITYNQNKNYVNLTTELTKEVIKSAKGKSSMPEKVKSVDIYDSIQPASTMAGIFSEITPNDIQFHRMDLLGDLLIVRYKINGYDSWFYADVKLTDNEIESINYYYNKEFVKK